MLLQFHRRVLVAMLGGILLCSTLTVTSFNTTASFNDLTGFSGDVGVSSCDEGEQIPVNYFITNNGPSITIVLGFSIRDSGGTVYNPTLSTIFWNVPGYCCGSKQVDATIPTNIGGYFDTCAAIWTDFSYTTQIATTGWQNSDLYIYDDPIVELYSFTIDDDNSGSSSGNDNGNAEAGETIELIVTLENTGTGVADDVSAIISISNSYISITDDYETYGDIGRGDTATCSADYDFDIDSSCPSGWVTFNIDIIDDAGYSCHFWQDTISIYIYISSSPSQNPSLEYYSFSIDDDNSGESSGNGDGDVDASEEIELIVTLRNVGSGTAYDVEATLSESNSLISITDGNENYGDITSGDTEACEYDFGFAVDSSCPSGWVTFTLNIYDSDSNSWTDTFSVYVNELISENPSVEYNDFSIDDDNSGESSGNGDGDVDAGEEIELILTLRNVGSGTAYGVTAYLSEFDSLISLSDDDEYYGDIASGDTERCEYDFDFTVDSAHVTGWVTFELSIYDSGGNCWTETFSIYVNAIQSPTEVANLVIESDGLFIQPGDSVEISGYVEDVNDNLVGGIEIEIDDPVSMTCESIITNQDGRFIYSKVISQIGHYLFGFHIGDLHRYAIVDVSYSQNFAAIQSLNLYNEGENPVLATISLDEYSLDTVIQPGETKTAIEVDTDAPILTPYVGYCPVSGGVLQGCVDSSGTISVMGGEVIYGGGYVTSEGDFGGCLGLGGGLPFSVQGQAVLCLGTDGFNLDLSGTLGVAQGGVKIDIVALADEVVEIIGNSPIDLHLYTEDWAHVGYNYTAEEMDNNIADSYFNSNHPETFILNNTELAYVLMVVGTGYGPYKIDFNYYDTHNTLTSHSFDGSINLGEVLYFDVKINKNTRNAEFMVEKLMYAPDPAVHDISISPTGTSVSKGENILFNAVGYNEFDLEIPIIPSWESSSGTISSAGLYEAEEVGTHVVYANISDVSGSTTIIVTQNNDVGTTVDDEINEYDSSENIIEDDLFEEEINENSGIPGFSIFIFIVATVVSWMLFSLRRKD